MHSENRMSSSIDFPSINSFEMFKKFRNCIENSNFYLCLVLIPVVPDVLHIVVIFHGLNELFHVLDILFALQLLVVLRHHFDLGGSENPGLKKKPEQFQTILCIENASAISHHFRTLLQTFFIIRGQHKALLTESIAQFITVCQTPCNDIPLYFFQNAKCVSIRDRASWVEGVWGIALIAQNLSQGRQRLHWRELLGQG